jgi:hypothetical protein
MEVMNTGYMIIPVILFVSGIIVSFALSSMGIERLEDDNH